MVDQYLIRFIEEKYILGSDPISGYPYRCDAAQLSAAFNRFLTPQGQTELSSRNINALIMKSYRVVKTEIGGKVVFLGLSCRDNIQVYIEKPKRQEGHTVDKATYYQEYHRQRQQARHNTATIVPERPVVGTNRSETVVHTNQAFAPRETGTSTSRSVVTTTKSLIDVSSIRKGSTLVYPKPLTKRNEPQTVRLRFTPRPLSTPHQEISEPE